MDPYIDAVKEISPTFTSVTGASVTVEGFGYDGLHEKQIVACSQGDSSYDVLFVDGIWIGEFVEGDCKHQLKIYGLKKVQTCQL